MRETKANRIHAQTINHQIYFSYFSIFEEKKTKISVSGVMRLIKSHFVKSLVLQFQMNDDLTKDSNETFRFGQQSCQLQLKQQEKFVLCSDERMECKTR